MSRDTILVIGAGASHGARPSTDLRPPLGKDLAGYLLEWFDANRPRAAEFWHSHAARFDHAATSPPDPRIYDADPDIRPVLVEAVTLSKDSPTSFETVMGRLLAAGERRLLSRLNSVVAQALLLGERRAFMPGEDLYDKLFARLGGRLRAIISPNYDLLDVEALERCGLRFRFVGESIRRRIGVALYRFHGSSNYFQPSGVGRSASLDTAREMARPLKAKRQRYIASLYNDHALAVPFGRQEAISEHKHGTMQPVLVTYGPGKDATDGRQHLDAIRRACRRSLRRNPPARIIALGVSPPRGGGDDDAWESLWEAFKALDSDREYWSKDREERRKMTRYGFRECDGYFEELLCELG